MLNDVFIVDVADGKDGLKEVIIFKSVDGRQFIAKSIVWEDITHTDGYSDGGSAETLDSNVKVIFTRKEKK